MILPLQISARAVAILRYLFAVLPTCDVELPHLLTTPDVLAVVSDVAAVTVDGANCRLFSEAGVYEFEV